MVRRLTSQLLLWTCAGACLLILTAWTAEAGEEQTLVELEKQRLLRVLQLVELYEQQEEPARAIPYLVEAFEIDPSNQQIAGKLVSLLYQQERWTEIVAVYERLLEARPQSRRQNLPTLASYLFKAGQAERALAALEQLEKEFADSPDTYLTIGDVLLKAERCIEARAGLERAAELFPGQSLILRELGETYAKLEDYEKATATYEAALACVKDDAERRWILNELMPLYAKAGRLDELAERVLAACRDSELRIPRDDLDAMIRALAASGEDKYSETLLPLLDHQDSRVAVLVVRAMGSGSENRYFPPLLLHALESERPEVVNEAISWSPNCWDRERAPLVHERLRRIFESDNETLKFHACFPLMHGYKDREAIAYLLEQTGSKDPQRARRAVGWLGDACNSHTPVYPELLEKLEPLLGSDDRELRRAAFNALGTYEGEAVIRHLISALGDTEDIIAQEACYHLAGGQRDLDAVQRLVSEALEQETRDDVKQRMRRVLSDLERKKDQMTRSQ